MTGRFTETSGTNLPLNVAKNRRTAHISVTSWGKPEITRNIDLEHKSVDSDRLSSVTQNMDRRRALVKQKLGLLYFIEGGNF